MAVVRMKISAYEYQKNFAGEISLLNEETFARERFPLSARAVPNFLLSVSFSRYKLFARRAFGSFRNFVDT